MNGCVDNAASLSWRTNVGVPERSRVDGSSVEGDIPILLVRQWVGLNLGKEYFLYCRDWSNVFLILTMLSC